MRLDDGAKDHGAGRLRSQLTFDFAGELLIVWSQAMRAYGTLSIFPEND